jgi:hypothetical protein
MWVSMPSSTAVRRARGVVKPGICSANVFAAQTAASQKKRRIRSWMSIGCPPIDASTSQPPVPPSWTAAARARLEDEVARIEVTRQHSWPTPSR